MRRIRLALALCALVCLALPAVAGARPNVRVSRLGAAPATLRPGQSLAITGRAAARRRRVRRARVTVRLRRAGNSRTLGAEVVRRIAARRSKRFRVHAVVPAHVAGGGYRLLVCARSACRTLRLVTVDTASGPPSGAPASAPGFAPGAESVGDRLFPALGNGGYDAQRYDLVLAYAPAARTLAGTTTITALATQNLSRFSLDFQGFAISSVTVDGAAAAAARAATKLRVTPPAGIPKGSTFSVAVTYAGTPPVITDPDGSTEGFLQTGDGAFVVGEPMGAQGWFPNDNHPTDKATMKVSMTVPAGLTAIGNGRLVSSVAGGGSRTWVWEEAAPMATYLATATIGHFGVSRRSVAGLDYYDAADPAAGPATGVAGEPGAVALFADRFGPYPFDVAGSIVDNAPGVGYALEAQTKPLYPSGAAADPTTVGHELAHQWFGDSVSVAQWQDIWLSEGFATYSQWLYDEARGAGTTKQHLDAGYAKPAGSGLWQIPPAVPASASEIFAPAIYERGAMTLEALREIVGDGAFYAIMRTWAAEHAYGNAATPQFIALAERGSGKRLGAFFADWLYDADKPAITPATFGG